MNWKSFAAGYLTKKLLTPPAKKDSKEAAIVPDAEPQKPERVEHPFFTALFVLFLFAAIFFGCTKEKLAAVIFAIACIACIIIPLVKEAKEIFTSRPSES